MHPHSLSLITTYQCTSQCPNCCFNCSPLKQRVMTINEIKSYIDMSTNYYTSIKTVIFTGGECSLLGIDTLTNAINYAQKKGLSTRIVTNANWASNKNKALFFISQLAIAGLDELNISTGDEHTSFVPITNVLYAIQAAITIKKIKSIVIAVENQIGNKITNQYVIDRIKEFLTPKEIKLSQDKLIIIADTWVRFSDIKSHCKFNDSNNTDNTNIKGCDNIFTSININPNGEMLSCCGLAAEYSPFLRLGQLNSNNNIKELYENQFNDFLKIWLYTEGPSGIISYLEKHHVLKDNKHECSFCLNLLSDHNYIQKLLNTEVTKIKAEFLKLDLKNITL